MAANLVMGNAKPIERYVIAPGAILILAWALFGYQPDAYDVLKASVERESAAINSCKG